MNRTTAIKILLWLITGVTLFHLSILIKLVPYDITWGGRLNNDAEMYVFEAISLSLNLLLGLALLIKGNYIRAFLSIKVVNIVLWVFLVLFGLNTIGNIFAETNVEKLFAILTLMLSGLLWQVLKPNRQDA